MALSTYTELKATVADWLNRQDLAAQIPDFIRLLEVQVQRTLRVRQMLGEYTTTIDGTSGGRITLPDDFLALHELRMTRGSDSRVIPIEYASKHELSTILGEVNAAGTPRAYCVSNTDIEVAPYPDASFTITLFYWQKIPPLSGSVASNWLLADHPDVYLFGSMLQAAPYLKNDERVQMWSTALTSLLEDMRVADERATKAGTPLKMRFKPYG